MRFATTLLLLPMLGALGACPGPEATPDARPVDAAVDAPGGPDAAQCAGELFLTGEYVDWDSTDTNFHGVANATFAIDNDANPAHTDLTSPNGRAELCLPATGRSRITITPAAAGPQYLIGHFVADAAVFASGRIFSLRGLTPARASTFYAQFAPLAFDAGKPQLLVNVSGTPVPITLGGASAEATLVYDKTAGTWSAGGTNTGTGNLVLFANLDGSAPTISGATIGDGALTATAGELTMITVVGQ
ncbi:MAG: hypothetical protein K8W52_25900 [Deltaproteobacteria bacterium]|nr:hypothetical protein [Deltaproteobacteria bacterium]